MLSEAVAVIVIKLPLATIAPDKGEVIVTVGEIVSNSFGVGVGDEDGVGDGEIDVLLQSTLLVGTAAFNALQALILP